ncbi:hypothetical protein FJY94_01260 [Candidatus Kaiserbacteria bacterium]|nr:hypothetical protein [Candidatus Kaiserbacteria bacterium]
MSVSRSLAVLAVLIVTAFVVSWFIGVFSQRPVSIETPMRELPPPAKLTQERTVKAIGNKSFAALVSFTGARFEPATVHVKAGDTVRYFNASKQQMILVFDGAPANIPPGEYLEHTFTHPGTANFTEAQSKVNGTVIVQ